MTGKEILHKIKTSDRWSHIRPRPGLRHPRILERASAKSQEEASGMATPWWRENRDTQWRIIKKVDDNELGLFAVFDGHLGHSVAHYLPAHLFENILKEPEFFSDIETALRKAHDRTDNKILEKSAELGRGGSIAVSAILSNGLRLVVANAGDSRAVLSKNGVAIQLSVDHEPSAEQEIIEEKGGFVSNLPGDVPCVDGQLAVARAFGDGSLKKHLSSEPLIVDETVDDDTELLILASDGLWKDPQTAAKNLTEEAVARKSKDEISCIVVKFS
ncbi:hypothetical protein ZIOFF_006222 [Zingiber officinale]|uniref:protein-serine/threonine phosphatase n=1 Tax=Zingiber officinale TaxID=94328 RepID=A0A8J5HVC4_ZINOF|nr:hypothetical protein ZIOFF_006222 [Zingiber officinale]